MGVKELKQQILESLDSMSQRNLKIVHNLVKSLEEADDIVGYRPDGYPITKLELNYELTEAREQVDAGNYMTTEELRKRIGLKK